MKRTPTLTLATTAALLALAACQPATTTSSGSDQASDNPTVSTTTRSVDHPASAGPSSTPTSAKASPKAASPTSCPDRPDIYLWMRTPGAPDAAQRLGGTNMETCEPSYKMLMATAPTVAGSCTEIAAVSDNPSYNPDATPAGRLKKVQFFVGPAC